MKGLGDSSAIQLLGILCQC